MNMKRNKENGWHPYPSIDFSCWVCDLGTRNMWFEDINPFGKTPTL